MEVASFAIDVPMAGLQGQFGDRSLSAAAAMKDLISAAFGL